MQAPPQTARKRAARSAPTEEQEAAHVDEVQEHEDANHELRATFRSMHDDLDKRREELSRPDDPNLAMALRKQEGFFPKGALPCFSSAHFFFVLFLVQQSKRTTVSVLDTELLKLGSEIALEKASRIQTTFHAQEPIELILHLNKTYHSKVSGSELSRSLTPLYPDQLARGRREGAAALPLCACHQLHVRSAYSASKGEEAEGGEGKTEGDDRKGRGT